MASPVDDPKSYLTIGQTVWGGLVIVFGLGAGWANLKRDIARSKERHDGHDKKFQEFDRKLERLAEKDDLETMKSDLIREIYALHNVDYNSIPRVIDRRREPR